jgi:hypothetical protein
MGVNRALYVADAINQPQLKDDIRHPLSFYKQGKPYIAPVPKSLSDTNMP